MKASLPFILAAALMAVDGGIASAQSGSRSFGSFEVARLRNQSIGTANFTSAGINRLTLAQSRAQAPRTGVGTIDRTTGVNPPGGFPSGVSSAPTRPFSGVSRRPSLSPFLQLSDFSTDTGFSQDFGIGFQTTVQPQLQQQRASQQAQLQQQQLNARLQQIAAQPAFNQRGSQQLAPTGQPGGVYRFYSHYYPTLR